MNDSQAFLFTAQCMYYRDPLDSPTERHPVVQGELGHGYLRGPAITCWPFWIPMPYGFACGLNGWSCWKKAPRPWLCETGQSLCWMSMDLSVTISSRRETTCEERESFSLLKISTLACRLASHCFFRCRHLSAATLHTMSVLINACPLRLLVSPVPFEEILPLLFVGHLSSIPMVLFFLYVDLFLVRIHPIHVHSYGSIVLSFLS